MTRSLAKQLAIFGGLALIGASSVASFLDEFKEFYRDGVCSRRLKVSNEYIEKNIKTTAIVKNSKGVFDITPACKNKLANDLRKRPILSGSFFNITDKEFATNILDIESCFCILLQKISEKSCNNKLENAQNSFAKNVALCLHLFSQYPKGFLAHLCHTIIDNFENVGISNSMIEKISENVQTIIRILNATTIKLKSSNINIDLKELQNELNTTFRELIGHVLELQCYQQGILYVDLYMKQHRFGGDINQKMRHADIFICIDVLLIISGVLHSAMGILCYDEMPFPQSYDAIDFIRFLENDNWKSFDISFQEIGKIMNFTQIVPELFENNIVAVKQYMVAHPGDSKTCFVKIENLSKYLLAMTYDEFQPTSEELNGDI